ncbi:MAG: DUF4416 family protein, partial [Candidatus Competibacteraceae bacterium]|nr:DUF4416 family protein [Candidatus Competibacteraceae bacterium]
MGEERPFPPATLFLAVLDAGPPALDGSGAHWAELEPLLTADYWAHRLPQPAPPLRLHGLLRRGNGAGHPPLPPEFYEQDRTVPPRRRQAAHQRDGGPVPPRRGLRRLSHGRHSRSGGRQTRQPRPRPPLPEPAHPRHDQGPGARIPLGEGIYGELTLIYEKKDYRALPWTIRTTPRATTGHRPRDDGSSALL